MLKIKVDFKSLFQRGVVSLKDDFGIFLITGYQGSLERLGMLST